MVILLFVVGERLQQLHQQFDTLKEQRNLGDFYANKLRIIGRLVNETALHLRTLQGKVVGYIETDSFAKLKERLETVHKECLKANSQLEELEANIRTLCEIYKKKNSYLKEKAGIYENMSIGAGSLLTLWVLEDLLVQQRVFNKTKTKICLGLLTGFSYYNSIRYFSKDLKFTQVSCFDLNFYL